MLPHEPDKIFFENFPKSIDFYAHNVYNIYCKGDAFMTAREVEKILTADGWYYKNSKGSHKQFKHPSKPGKVTVPQHKGDLNNYTVKSIMEQAGLK